MSGDPPPLALQLVFLGKHLGLLLEHRLSGRGFNRTQTIILDVLARRPGLQSQELCGPARVEPASITRTLQALERQGLVERCPHPTDGRASLLYLTGSGQRLAQELAGELEQLSTELLAGIDPQDLPVLERSVQDLMRNTGSQLRSHGCRPEAPGHDGRHGHAGAG